MAWRGVFRHYDRADRGTPGGLEPEQIGAIAMQYGVHMV